MIPPTLEKLGTGECPPAKRDRPPSPNGTEIQDNVAPNISKRSRTEINAEKRQMLFQKRSAEARDRGTEQTQRRILRPEERLEQRGVALRAEIRNNPDMIAFLEISRSKRAQCRAKEDCFYFRNNAECGKFIWSDARICVEVPEYQLMGWGSKQYYHVQCISCMISPEDLIPDKFMLEGSWGLMVRKWYQHKGCVDLDNIAAYIGRYKAYEKKVVDWDEKYADWSLHHRRHCKDGSDPATCGCPPAPNAPDKPVLQNYTTGQKKVELWEVMLHDDVWEMCDIQEGDQIVMPETEAPDQVDGKPQEDGGRK